MRFVESKHVEYKRELSESLEKGVVAFLNSSEGGVIYIGIDAKTQTVAGIKDADTVQLQIKDRIKNNIAPSSLGLFDVLTEKMDGRQVVKITVAGGYEKPYHLKKYGMSEKGCFIRIGSAAEPMNSRMIDSLFSKRARNTIGLMNSPRKDLTFEQLKIFYQEAGYPLNDNFAVSLELLTPDSSFNYAAYLLSDKNGISIKVAKYEGTNRVHLAENNEYGYCSLVKAAKLVLGKLEVENRTFTKITSKERLQRRMIDETALREAVINAIVHNDYSYEAPPKFELFSDRIEITSAGGLPFGLAKVDFFSGISVPRNKELMRVFKDLELVEYLGSGIPRIRDKYDDSVFQFTDNFLRIVFKYAKGYGQAAGPRPESQPELQPESQPGSLKARVLAVLEAGAFSKKEISVKLGQKEISGRLNQVIRELLANGMIGYTISDKPNSRLQKYKLTALGKKGLRKSAKRMAV